MSGPDLAALFDDLVRVETAVWNAVDARLRARHGLTFAQFETLRALHALGPCRVVDVAAGLGIGWAGASKIVGRIEALGHCTRTRHPDDGRASLTVLTTSGRAIVRDAATSVEEELARLLGPHLSTGEVQTLAAVFARLRGAALSVSVSVPSDPEPRMTAATRE